MRGVQGCKPADSLNSTCRAEANLNNDLNCILKDRRDAVHSGPPSVPGSSSMKVRLLLGLQLLLLGALSVGGVTIAPLRRSMALGVLRKLVDLEKVGAR